MGLELGSLPKRKAGPRDTLEQDTAWRSSCKLLTVQGHPTKGEGKRRLKNNPHTAERGCHIHFIQSHSGLSSAGLEEDSSRWPTGEGQAGVCHPPQAAGFSFESPVSQKIPSNSVLYPGNHPNPGYWMADHLLLLASPKKLRLLAVL